MGMTQDTICDVAGARPATGRFALPWLLGLGAAVYAISFALPAVEGRPGGAVSGWECAWVVLAVGFGEHPFSFVICAIGLINPLTLVYCLLRVLHILPRVRRGLAIAALSFVPLCWYVMAHDLRVEIGHLAWVAGLLLMLLPEALGMASRRRAVKDLLR